jgi:hypothetical protein
MECKAARHVVKQSRVLNNATASARYALRDPDANTRAEHLA